MDTDGVLYFRISATIMASLSVLLNSLVLYFVVFKTPKEYRNFSIIYGTFSAVEVIGGVIGWSVIHEIGVTIDDTIFPIISYGACGNVGPYFCFFMDQFTFPMLGFITFLAPLSMGYRIYCFTYQPLSTKGVWIWLLVQALPWCYCWVSIIFYVYCV